VTPIEERYKRAEQLLPWNMTPFLNNVSLIPHWVDESCFWFKRDLPNHPDGYEFVLVDSKKKTERAFFDHQRLADILTKQLDHTVCPQQLPITDIGFRAENTLSFNLDSDVLEGKRVLLELGSYRLSIESICVGADKITASLDEDKMVCTSPDGKQGVICRFDNLILRELATGAERNLTHDGIRHYGYGTYSDFTRLIFLENQPVPPAVLWSPNGRYLAVQRTDERLVKEMPLLQSVPKDHSFRAVHCPYKLALPGDTHIPLVSLCIIDLETGNIISSDRTAVPAAGGGFMELLAVCWGADNCLYHTEWTRDRQIVRLVAFDPVSGISRVLVEEADPHHNYIHPGPTPFFPTVFEVIPEINEFIWYSHDSGWGHLYRYELSSGKLKNVVTSDEFVVTALHKVDTENFRVYFTACGRESDQNPYYEHFYRINLDGSDLVLLTPDAGQHDIIGPDFFTGDSRLLPNIHGLSPDGRVFVDTVSRHDLPYKSTLRSTLDGAELMMLAQCDSSLLATTPYNQPLSFTVKAADGITDLWGVMHRPSDFDDSKCYPVILAIYGGPQLCIVPKRFAEFGQYVGKIVRPLAELGFIVVKLDPRGTPFRSRDFQSVICGNMQNGGGIEDQIVGLQQLGERYSWMDLDRVGITGHSSGGFSAARGMLSHPDFFKVAVSSAGSHDHRAYSAGWGETFQGLVDGDNYQEQASSSLAQNLKGKLLLVHGDMDPNVHISNTLQLVNKLIEHNKNFDLLVLPNRGHDYMQDTYFIRRVWDYFIEHLLNEKPPQDYCISPLQNGLRNQYV